MMERLARRRREPTSGTGWPGRTALRAAGCPTLSCRARREKRGARGSAKGGTKRLPEAAHGSTVKNGPRRAGPKETRRGRRTRRPSPAPAAPSGPSPFAGFFQSSRNVPYWLGRWARERACGTTALELSPRAPDGSRLSPGTKEAHKGQKKRPIGNGEKVSWFHPQAYPQTGGGVKRGAESLGPCRHVGNAASFRRTARCGGRCRGCCSTERRPRGFGAGRR